MTIGSTPDREYIKRKGDWVALWEVMADPVRFAAKFNTTVPGAYRLVSAEGHSIHVPLWPTRATWILYPGGSGNCQRHTQV